MTVGDMKVFDSETIFPRLLMVRQNRCCSWHPYSNMTIPALPIDENGCLRKGNKSILANRLGLKQVSVPAPDIVIVDMQQILCHIVWPHGGDASDLSEISSAFCPLTLLVQSRF